MKDRTSVENSACRESRAPLYHVHSYRGLNRKLSPNIPLSPTCFRVTGIKPTWYSCIYRNDSDGGVTCRGTVGIGEIVDALSDPTKAKNFAGRIRKLISDAKGNERVR